MTLAPSLSTTPSLYRKLEREAYRAYHARSALHKADHFFNFCVTAGSMRDYFLEEAQKLTQPERQPFYDEWAKVDVLQAAAEIGNSAKHLALRLKTGEAIASKTKGVKAARRKFVDILLASDGSFTFRPVKRSEVLVTLGDGRTIAMYQFMEAILHYWRAYLQRHGIRVRRQSLRMLKGAH